MEAEPCVMFQGVMKESAAFRLMQQMGWQEGLGLGKDNQGMKSHIRVSKKSDNSGLGIDAKAKAQANWALNTHAYDSILKNLKVQVAENLKKGGDFESSSDDDEEEVKRDEAAAEVVEIKPKKVARPQGRYKKREQGKMVGSYSSTDLAAILGAVAGKTETSKPAEENIIAVHVPAASDPLPFSDREPSSSVTSKKVLKKRKKKTPEADVESSNKENEPEEDVGVPLAPLPADWWGLKYGFVRAGHLGATRDPPKVRTGDENATTSSKDPSVRTAFREQDQEDLYNLVNNKATTGKKGLGRGDQPKKIGGAHFKGQKKVFDSSSEDEEEEEGSEEEEGTSEMHVEDEGKSTNDNSISSGNDSVREGVDADACVEESKFPKRRKIDNEGKCDSEKDGSTVEAASEEKAESTQSWRKLVKQLLAEAPSQTLSFRRLQKRVMAAGLFTEEALSFKLKLQKSSRFVLEGKTVSLATKVGA
ncbi:hypothetical protein R1flu_017019 [Riccia fluitans]|uniref:G-patch domain-containing protein n=1 Tax=Riccia fluitans TaxID=41844 RepID=A0ABD1YP14_9MARC